jgi:hypothetical protein
VRRAGGDSLQTDKTGEICAEIVKNYQTTVLLKLYHNQFIITERKKDCKKGLPERWHDQNTVFFSLPGRQRRDKVKNLTAI